jgi:hypothetical protein
VSEKNHANPNPSKPWINSEAEYFAYLLVIALLHGGRCSWPAARLPAFATINVDSSQNVTSCLGGPAQPQRQPEYLSPYRSTLVCTAASSVAAREQAEVTARLSLSGPTDCS